MLRASRDADGIIAFNDMKSGRSFALESLSIEVGVITQIVFDGLSGGDAKIVLNRSGWFAGKESK